MSDDLLHYGILRESGRYPWGSGKDPYQRSMQFYGLVDEMRKKGLTDPEIAKAIGLTVKELDPTSHKGFTVAQLRDTRTIAKENKILYETRAAVKLRDKGVSVDVISETLGLPKATVRLRLANSENLKQSALMGTADMLRREVDAYDIVDVGKATNIGIGVSIEKMRAALGVLHDEGYTTYIIKKPNVGTGHMISHRVLVKPGVEFKDAAAMSDRIHTMGEWTEDGGISFLNIREPLSVDPKRVGVAYESSEDGMVYVRAGVEDLSMGKNRYSQVRIAVDGTHYIKGIALVRDDMPPGVDLMVHTNKKPGTPLLGEKNNSVLKPMADDPDNPFGSIIKRQIISTDPKTGEQRVTSAINIVNEEGDWDDWRNSLPAQMLAKQPHSLIKSQLKTTRDQVKARLEEIDTITNPVIRKNALEKFAAQIDADAVDLRAAATSSRQKTQVIIPLPKMNKNEVYAPNFETGERVVLIRYPHGGKFEIPELTVNNNSRIAKKLLGNAVDAVGIHPAVAERLSGADFDGDTVVVIPNPKGLIKGSKSMSGTASATFEKGLANFDPKRIYGGYKEVGVNPKGKPIGNFKLMTNTGREMGMITNLITDMSIQAAKPEHVVRAVRHSMVVIDAEKHQLDYKKSEIDNGIAQLKELYQGSSQSGASTLLSKATAKVHVPQRKLRLMQDGGPIDPETGALVYTETGNTRSAYDSKTKTYDRTKKVLTEEKVKRLALTDDAYTLVRDPRDPVERLYADHANEMKGIANKTRLKASRIPSPKTNPVAKKAYPLELANLNRQLKEAERQLPLERKANAIAASIVKAKRADDPTLREDRDRLKKTQSQAKKAARARLGLTKPTITISDREWDAIQSGAVSKSKLESMLKYTEPKRIQELSMPRKNSVMTKSVSSRAATMLSAGMNTADVARSLGISASTLREAIKRGDV